MGKKVALTARLFNYDGKGQPHKPGTVVVDGADAFLVETSGSLRRVQVIEQTLQGVRYQAIRKQTKAEKKALKRSRARARAALADAAIRIARRTLAEASHA